VIATKGTVQRAAAKCSWRKSLRGMLEPFSETFRNILETPAAYEGMPVRRNAKRLAGETLCGTAKCDMFSRLNTSPVRLAARCNQVRLNAVSGAWRAYRM
jgi:hypothetical protein